MIIISRLLVLSLDTYLYPVIGRNGYSKTDDRTLEHHIKRGVDDCKESGTKSS